MYIAYELELVDGVLRRQVQLLDLPVGLGEEVVIKQDVNILVGHSHAHHVHFHHDFGDVHDIWADPLAQDVRVHGILGPPTLLHVADSVEVLQLDLVQLVTEVLEAQDDLFLEYWL